MVKKSIIKEKKVEKKVEKEEKKVEKEENVGKGVMKMSILKKMMYSNGVERMKPDIVNDVNELINKRVEKYVDMVSRLEYGKLNTVNDEDVSKLLNINKEDLPKEVCKTYKSDKNNCDEEKEEKNEKEGKDKKNNKKVEYYKETRGKCYYLSRNVFTKLVNNVMKERGIERRLNGSIYGMMQWRVEMDILEYLMKVRDVSVHRRSRTIERKDFEIMRKLNI